ncbi:MAG: universal stress protein [Sandaracinaceae bacterium]
MSAFTQSLLVATDFSPAADVGLRKAAELAHAVGAKVTVCHVLDPSPLSPSATRGDAEEQLAREQDVEGTIHAALEEVAEAHFSGLETKVALIISTNAADGIVNYADKEDTDLIVLSTHGRTGLAHFLIGSVAERVVRHASCPVLTVRTGDGEAEGPE